ncbi:uncharacterized protein LOC108103527 [Drosophila eugracilis]|uniref:uncharacterized protein LOC108103527 n=1 Tax=Drosophila eugracilis TaxID=29029 RepID=UPI0007E656D0|nr:uncharacterized protein LOC108103527 [Drosophila eugracilis]
MSRYQYADHCLEAFNVFHRPLELDEVAGYVAEMEAKSVDQVRLAVDNTLTAGWLHGFLTMEDGMYTLSCGYWDEEHPATGKKGTRHLKKSILRSTL